MPDASAPRNCHVITVYLAVMRVTQSIRPRSLIEGPCNLGTVWIKAAHGCGGSISKLAALAHSHGGQEVLRLIAERCSVLRGVHVVGQACRKPEVLECGAAHVAAQGLTCWLSQLIQYIVG